MMAGELVRLPCPLRPSALDLLLSASSPAAPQVHSACICYRCQYRSYMTMLVQTIKDSASNGRDIDRHGTCFESARYVRQSSGCRRFRTDMRTAAPAATATAVSTASTARFVPTLISNCIDHTWIVYSCACNGCRSDSPFS